MMLKGKQWILLLFFISTANLLKGQKANGSKPNILLALTDDQGWGDFSMYREEVTIAEMLKDEGYATACFGKWHNGKYYPEDPSGQGFDHFLGFAGGHISNYFNLELTLNQQSVKVKGIVSRE